MRSPLPVRQGVGATRLRVPVSGWASVAEYMVERFGHLDPERILQRFDRGEVVARSGEPLTRATALGMHAFVWYYRDPLVEREIPFDIDVLHSDPNLIVIDKPHFLPTTPGGKFLQNSALVRLRNEMDNPDITPIHRLDRATAGVLMFSANPYTRGAYQLMFETRTVQKTYEAVSALPQSWDATTRSIDGVPLPLTYRNRIEKQKGHVRVLIDEEGEPNSETRIEWIADNDTYLHTRLLPHTGKMHQLRVHLAAIGAGILNDGFYPVLEPDAPDDFTKPLQLLARRIAFTDPLAGTPRVFKSGLRLAHTPE